MKKKVAEIACLFLDVGGVLLSDGWDRYARKRAVRHFALDAAETEDRHLQSWNTHQEGKLSLDAYLSHVIFHKKRSFTRARFRRFMFAQSKPYPEMIRLIGRIKARQRLKIVVLSNEGRELNAYRIRKFQLNELADFYVSSCFVHLLKPDMEIFRLALDLAQVSPQQSVYIENTPLFVEIAESLGIRSILHTDARSTAAQLASFGLPDVEGNIHETG